jgi:hypothetical protein
MFILCLVAAFLGAALVAGMLLVPALDLMEP